MNDIHLVKVPMCSEAYSAGVTACAIQISAKSVDRGLRATDDWRQVSCPDCRNTIAYNKAMYESRAVGQYDSW